LKYFFNIIRGSALEKIKLSGQWKKIFELSMVLSEPETDVKTIVLKDVATLNLIFSSTK
jgi:hypothetical protein